MNPQVTDGASEDVNPFSSMPSYMVAANNHSIASGGLTVTDYFKGLGGAGAGALIGSVVPGLGTAIGAVVGGAIGAATAITDGKWAMASAASGALSFYNTGIKVSNWFGANNQEVETTAFLASYDSDLAKYYQENTLSSDLTGFIGGSLFPVLGSLKAYNAATSSLNAAKMGKYGKNFEKATGLLAPQQANYLQKAAIELATQEAPMAMTNANMLKAFAVGAAEESIQGAVASIAVLATMNASPILTHMDASDIAKNVLEGAIFGGVVGGVLRGVGAYGAVAKVTRAIEAETKPLMFQGQLQNAASDADNLVNALYNREAVSQAKTGTQFSAGTAEITSYQRTVQTRTIAAIDNEITTFSTKLANDDNMLGNMISTELSLGKSFEEQASVVTGIVRIARLGQDVPEEVALLKAAAANKELDKLKKTLGIIDEKELAKLEKQAKAAENLEVTHLKLWGAESRQVTSDAPSVPFLTDSLKRGETLEITATKVRGGGRTFGKFDPDIGATRWDPAEHTVQANQARQVWMMDPKGYKFPEGKIMVHDSDLPAIRKLITEGRTNDVWIIDAEGVSRKIGSKDTLVNTLYTQIEKAVRKELTLREDAVMDDAAQLFAKKGESTRTYHTDDEFAAIMDIKPGYVAGTAMESRAPLTDVFAMKSYADEYTKVLVDAGKYDLAKGSILVWRQPQNVKFITDTSAVKDLDGNVVEGIARVQANMRLNQLTANNAVAATVGPDLYAQLPELSTSPKAVMDAQKGGEGQKRFSAANGNYGSFGSVMQQVGRTTAAITKRFHEITTDAIVPSAAKLGSDQAATAEWVASQQVLRGTPEVYYLDETKSALRLRRLVLEEEAIEAGKAPKKQTIVDPEARPEIPLSADVAEAWRAHISRNGTRIASGNDLKAANGFASALDPRAAYPMPRNPKDYPYFAFVTDPTITNTNRSSMIYASSEKELDTMIAQINSANMKLDVSIKNTQLKVRTKKEIEEYYRAQGMYSKEDTISESYIDIALKKTGISRDYQPPVDPKKVSSDFIEWHLEKDRQLARYAVVTKYSKEFNELQRLGESVTNIATSRAGGFSLAKFAVSANENQFQNYEKTALNVTDTASMPIWTAINNFADVQFSRAWNSVKEILTKDPSPNSLLEVNEAFSKMGLNTVYKDAAMMALANHSAGRGALTEFVSKANGMLATLVIRLDPINALNNTVGSTVLTSGELLGLVKAIEAKDSIKAGLLAKITLPGTGDSILAPSKLYAKAIANFFDKEKVAWAEKNGFLQRHLIEYQSLLDDLTLTGAETGKELGQRVNSAFKKFNNLADKGEKWTGNKLAEEFNRFVSADIAKQITDVAVEQGILTPKNALSYINTFVNRTQGNYLASQRPLLFQGAIGQSIGLFQTYQFNLAQQLLRNVAEGSAKNAAFTLGMQTSIYGMHGLPGFDYINAHIIGTMSGNKNNRDLYDATYGLAGKNVGDWLMYGMASNAMGILHPDLKMNLYTRGDINPRFATIVPITFADIPIVNATGKLLSSMKDTAGKLSAGGEVWGTMMQGIEHASINRPLAGLARTLQALGNPNLQSYSTSSKGNVIASNDLLSLANLTRIAGAKPLDEAIVQDSTFRLQVYKTADLKARKDLSAALKTTVIAGGMPTQEQINSFAEQYAAKGGKQEQFSQWMLSTMKSANTSQANLMARQLGDPHAQSIQRVMNGQEFRDFSNYTPE